MYALLQSTHHFCNTNDQILGTPFCWSGLSLNKQTDVDVFDDGSVTFDDWPLINWWILNDGVKTFHVNI